ncbi:HAD family hydrolase [Halovivax sp.]|uniref:HAD family hydrolase n=1 Tax=Halovivax sp. TaxID=1935978 RepID=UPI0025B7DB7E|nr:HAD family hydrolase [Halovivax sp.]
MTADDERADRDDGSGTERADAGAGIAERWDAIFWDVGGVILDVESVQAGHRRFVDRLVDERDLDVDPDEALDTWRTTVGEHFREREGTVFTPAREGYAKAVEAIVGEPLPEETWRPPFRETIAETLETNPGAVEAIDALAETDVHLGVLSDADRDELLFILEAFGVRERFDSLTISEDVGRTKPDPAMFEAALQAAGPDADPERCVMIGDRYRHDMAGASEFGMTTVAHGAEDGEAVDHCIEDDLTELLEILRGARD